MVQVYSHSAPGVRIPVAGSEFLAIAARALAPDLTAWITDAVNDIMGK